MLRKALEVVAEGVETADDLATLQSMGCPFMQGYHLGRPQPAEDILRFLDARPGADVQACLHLRGA